MTDTSIFKAYDVRGTYPNQLTKETAFLVARAFIARTGAKQVVVGHDARLSSPELFESLTAGLFAAGVQITTIGQTPTEGLYFALANYGFDAGIMITASHNPKEYNGFKMLTKQAGNLEMVRGTDLLPFIKEDGTSGGVTTKIQQLDIWPDYLAFMDQFSGTIKPFKVVVDASNGVIGAVMEKMQSSLPIKIIPLNFKPDGNFPNHSPNPLDKGANQQIADKIKGEKADFGFMFDGDADRIFLVDENGNQVSADIVLLLLAKHFLAKKPGSAVAYNLICSRSVPELITQWGGKPIRTQVGFVNVRQGIIDNNGIMGGELSAHYCFADYFYMDSGIIAFLTLLQIISKENKPVSELVKELSLYQPPVQMSFTVTDAPAILETIKKAYQDGKQDYLDGVTVEYKDWWFNVRPSNTEPLLKLTLEASTRELLEEKQQELIGIISQ